MNFTNQLLGNLKKTKVHSSFKDNIWGVDLADMQLISKYNKGIRCLLCAIDLLSKYAFVVPLKDKIQKENQIKYGLIKAVSFVTPMVERQ